MPPQILHVDDLRANRLVFEKAVAPLEARLTEADTGEAALALLAAQPFDLLVLDVHLPDINGFDVARRLRAEAANPNHDVPILFISTEHNALEDAIAAYELGAVDYLLRPVPPIILRGKVAALCGIQRAKRRIADQRDAVSRENDALAAALAAREESERRYRTLLDHSPEGIIVEVDGGVVYHNQVARELLGYCGSEGLGARSLPELAAPESRAPLADCLARARAGAWAGELLEITLLRRDGSRALVEATAAPVPYGARTGVQLILQDLGARRGAQEELLRVRAAVEGARDGVVITDAEGYPIFINIAFGNLFGYTLPALRQSGLDKVYADPRQAAEMIRRVLESEEFDEEAELLTRRGAKITALVRGSVVLDDSYRLIGATLVYTDISERKRLEEELRALSREDALTGAPNRRTFDAHLAAEWTRAVRHQSPLCVALIDIDFFKAYNDSHGHQAGDQCLRQVAHALAGACRRPGEMVARYGGEEFAAIFPGTGAIDGMRAAQGLLDAVAALALPHGHSAVSGFVTVSIGVASMIPDRHRHPAALVRAADRALYAAKAGGRNRVEDGTASASDAANE